MGTLSEIGQKMIFLLHRRDDLKDPKLWKGTVSWLLWRDGWLTPAWVSLTHYSSSRDIIRFRNDLAIKLPSSQWSHELPKAFRFELTAHADELDSEILTEIISYCELARTTADSNFDRHPPRFSFGGDAGHYGWTERAWKEQQRQNK